MYYNIAERTITPALTQNYELVTDVARQVQEALNKSAGLGLKAVKPKLNTDRVEGIINKLSSAENFDDVSWMLDEPVINFTQSVVDETIKANAEFHSKAGLQAKIVRKVAGNCCEWCRNLAGSYTYVDDFPDDVYRRHAYCRCIVTFNPGDGRRLNVHTKQWTRADEHDKIEARKSLETKSKTAETPIEKEKRIEQENNLGLADRIASHPKMLQTYTPQGLKKSLEKAGYDVKPMNNGNFRGITFEDGGGFKVNFGGDGILMYHPEERSHHDGAYYKISTGKGGKHRYDTNGNEIEQNGDAK